MNKSNGLRKLALIVDDEPRIGKILCLKLKLCGYHVISCTSGVEALDIIREQQPDVVLLDLLMPEMDGLEVLERVRTFSSIPIIVFTARPEGIEKAMRLGANGSLTKPFNPDQLVEKVRLILGTNGD